MAEDIPEGFEPEQSAPVNNSQTVASSSPNIPEGFEPETSGENTQHAPEFGEDFGEALSAGIKGFGRAVTLGQSDKWAQQEPTYPWQLPAEKAEDINAEAEKSPIATEVGKAIGSTALLFGTEGLGESAFGLKTAISKLPTYAKWATNAVKAGLEAGIIRGGDEVSDQALGLGDPEAPVASALANMRTAALFGMGIGGAFGGASSLLSKIGDTEVGQKMAQIGEDLGSKWKFLKENSFPVDAMRDEIDNFHNSTLQGGEAAWDLKPDAIKKLVPEMGPNISSQNQDISKTLQAQMDKMANKSKVYLPSSVEKFQSDINDWNAIANNPGSSSDDIFNATQDLKKKMQLYAKYGKNVNPLTELGAATEDARNLATTLKGHLENTNVWGDAATVQKGLNNSYSNLIKDDGPMETFVKKFMSNNGKAVVADPNKIDGLLSQLGKNKAGVKPDIIKNYIEAMENYRSEINDIHARMGVESPIQPSALSVTKESLGKPTVGGNIASFLHGSSDKVGSLIAEGTGGYFAGTPGTMIARDVVNQTGFGKYIGRPITKATGAALVKVLNSGAYRSTAEALTHANNINSGAQQINSALENLFTSGAAKAVDYVPSDKIKDKIKDHVSSGGPAAQLKQDLSKQPNGSSNPPSKGYAEGGTVEEQAQMPAPEQQTNEEEPGSLGAVYPQHNMMMQTAKARVFNYLNSLKPQDAQPQYPFDPKPDTKMAEKKYNKAINMAASPLSILNNVKDGSITLDDMAHFGSMYPEIHSHLSKQITKKILENQMSGDRPNYKTRQGLSVFLGAPMDSTFTPENIQAAQNVFAQQKAAQSPQQPMKAKKDTGKMGEMSKQYQTAEQAAQGRQIQER